MSKRDGARPDIHACSRAHENLLEGRWLGKGVPAFRGVVRAEVDGRLRITSIGQMLIAQMKIDGKPPNAMSSKLSGWQIAGRLNRRSDTHGS
jgi:hypothetical protein